MKKLKLENSLDINLGNKIRTNVLPNNEPSFRQIDLPIPQKNIFKGIRNQIETLETGKGIAISCKDTSFNIYELQKRISKIICLHKKKNIEKQFTTSVINDDEVGCWRTK